MGRGNDLVYGDNELKSDCIFTFINSVRMKNLISIFLVLSINQTIAQLDDLQWLVVNGNAKTGYDATNKKNIYASALSNFEVNGVFGIDSIDFPVQITSFIPRNDFFIIYNDGSFYNSRYVNHGQVWPDNSSNLRNYHIDPSKEVKYLYLTNIYEEDDPPELIRIDTPSDGQLLQFDETSDNVIQLNHDFSIGKDVTLIIPRAIVNQCTTNTFEVHYDNVIFQPSNIFNNGSSYSFYQDSNLQHNEGVISGLSKYEINNFLNFKVNPGLDSSYIGDTASFVVKCNSGTVVASILDTMRSSHDPNAIVLKCIYKHKMKRGRNRYVAIYKAQFENKGNRVVDSVTIRMKMPKSVKLDVIDAFKFRYGKKWGGRLHTDTFVQRKITSNMIEFKFKKGFLAPFDSSTINYNLFARGFVEFRVELNENPESACVELLPSEATVEFDGKVQNVELMVDLNKRKERIKRGDKRPIATKCECAPVWYKGGDCP
jgi:hypothetical protein